LLNYFYRHAVKPEFPCRFQWPKGSLAFWDNRATWHYAANDYQGEYRLTDAPDHAGRWPAKLNVSAVRSTLLSHDATSTIELSVEAPGIAAFGEGSGRAERRNRGNIGQVNESSVLVVFEVAVHRWVNMPQGMHSN
jgi:hypothetical protein